MNGVWVKSGVGDGTHATKVIPIKKKGYSRGITRYYTSARGKGGVVPVYHYQGCGLQGFPCRV